MDDKIRRQAHLQRDEIIDVQLNALSTQNHIRSVAPKPLFFNHGTSRSSRYLLPIMPLMPVSSIFCYK